MEQLSGQLLPAILAGVGEERAQPQLGHRGSSGAARWAAAGNEHIHVDQLGHPSGPSFEASYRVGGAPAHPLLLCL
jgi:hypothetical protein